MTTVLLVLATIAVLPQRVLWRRRMRRTAAALALVAGVAVAALLGVPAPLLAVAAALPVAAAVGWHRYSRSAGLVRRWGATARRKHGVASTLDVLRFAGALSHRRKATTVRPSRAELSRRDRARVRTTEVAVPLCRVGLARMWSSVEDVTVIFGGPRTGKSGWLAGRILDAPGAVLVTSTRGDLHALTAGLRAERGPVYVFNAVGLGGLPSTITFDPVTGCADPVTASERATDLLSASTHGGGGDREFWDSQARRVLAALLHAAALGRLSMRDVLGWVSDPDGAQRQLTSLLRKSPEPSYVLDATQFVTTNDRTRSSITSTIMPALGWLTNPAACAAATGREPFDVAELLASRAAVYLLGQEETQAAPLVTALTGHIAREARRLAAREPSGRLDPPLTLALDEAALISPVPLPSWTSDMGGRGVTIVACFQSRAQVIERWGPTGAAVILNNSAAVMVFGGTKDRDDLTYWSTLGGDRDEEHATTDATGKVTSRSVRKVPVLAPAQFATLRAGTVVVFRRGMPPAIGRVTMAWKRRDVKAHTRATRRAAAVAAIAQPVPHVLRPVKEVGE